MPSNVNPTLTDELTAALAVLAPIIRGLHDIVNDDLPAEVQAAVQAAISKLEKRRDLIQRLLNMLNNANSAEDELLADGYPTLPPIEVASAIFDALQGEKTDMEAAIAIFEEQSIAVSGTITVPPPTLKPPT